MSGSISLRHLPDISDASFSFQIPTDSADDLLRGQCDDLFGAEENLLESPAPLRTNDAPLTLSELTPISAPALVASSPKPTHSGPKSLLSTTRSNIYDPTSSQIASRVPKPTSATHSARSKSKPMSVENITPPVKAESIPSTLLALNAPADPLAPPKPVSKAGGKILKDISGQHHTSRTSVGLRSVEEGTAAHPPEYPEGPAVGTHSSTTALPPASSEELTTLVLQKSKKTVASGGIVKAKATTSAQLTTTQSPGSKQPRSIRRRASKFLQPQRDNDGDKVDSTAAPGDAGTGGMAARLVMYGQAMMGSWPTMPSESDDNPEPQTRHDVPRDTGADDVLAQEIRDAMRDDGATALTLAARGDPSDRDISGADNPMVVDGVADVDMGAPREDDLEIVAPSRSTSPKGDPLMHHDPCDEDPLTLSQLHSEAEGTNKQSGDADAPPAAGSTENLQDATNSKPASNKLAPKSKTVLGGKGTSAGPAHKTKAAPAKSKSKSKPATTTTTTTVHKNPGTGRRVHLVANDAETRCDGDGHHADPLEAPADVGGAVMAEPGTMMSSGAALENAEVISDNPLSDDGAGNPMLVDGDSEPGAALMGEADIGREGDAHDPRMEQNGRDEGPLTLSQLSPRKPVDAIFEDVATGGERALSPMRPSAKRPASAAAVALTRSKKSKVGGAEVGPRVLLADAARARSTRGRGGARIVSAPAQVRRQPVRRARDVSQPQAATSRTVDSAGGAPRVKDKSAKLSGAPHGVASDASSSSSTAKHASMLNATVPRDFKFPAAGQGTGLSESGPLESRVKAYSIPDFKTMHASQAAQSALRRSHLAPTVPVPIAFSTDARAKERERFDEMVREKERELEAAREVQRREREEEEAREVKELRKRAIPKAHEVPEWYKEAPRKNKGNAE
ncbi:hypothetical protein B0H11DRAFT_1164194 [Mycena galericulata]|nr:hypothetical protein B0H11DRAFT_1164194 [Mycena galericulata]